MVVRSAPSPVVACRDFRSTSAETHMVVRSAPSPVVACRDFRSTSAETDVLLRSATFASARPVSRCLEPQARNSVSERSERPRHPRKPTCSSAPLRSPRLGQFRDVWSRRRETRLVNEVNGVDIRGNRRAPPLRYVRLKWFAITALPTDLESDPRSAGSALLLRSGAVGCSAASGAGSRIASGLAALVAGIVSS